MEKKRFLILIALATLILSACGPEPEPTMSPEQVQGTAMGVAMTMVAETQAAIPTATPIPPTETAAPTLPPSPTPTFLLPLSLDAIPTNTLASASGDPCNQPLTTWDGESARLVAKNNTKPKGLVTLSLYFTTNTGQCGYIGTQFDSTSTLTVPIGVFSAGAFVDGKKDFKVFGGGKITPGSWSLWIENESIILRAGCAPNC